MRHFIQPISIITGSAPAWNECSATTAAALALAVKKEVGRFAFTGLYPFKIAERQFSAVCGPYLASASILCVAGRSGKSSGTGRTATSR